MDDRPMRPAHPETPRHISQRVPTGLTGRVRRRPDDGGNSFHDAPEMPPDSDAVRYSLIIKGRLITTLPTKRIATP